MPTNDESMPVEPEDMTAPATPETTPPEEGVEPGGRPPSPFEVMSDIQGAVLRGGRPEPLAGPELPEPPSPGPDPEPPSQYLTGINFTSPDTGEFKSGFSAIDNHFKAESAAQEERGFTGPRQPRLDSQGNVPGGFSDRLRRSGRGDLTSDELERANAEDPVRNEQGLARANTAENASLAYRYEDHKKSFAHYLINKDESLQDYYVANLAGQESFDPDLIFEQAGYSQEDIDRHRENWYKVEGYEVTEGSARGGKAANEAVASQNAERIAAQRENAQAAYGLGDAFADTLRGVGLGQVAYMGSHSKEEIIEYVQARFGVDRGEAERVAANAGSARDAYKFLSTENQKMHHYWEGVGYGTPHEDEDLGRYSVGLGDSFMSAFITAGIETPRTLAVLGTNIMSGAAYLTGIEISPETREMWDAYAVSTAEYIEQNAIATALVGRGLKNSGLILGSEGLTDWSHEAASLAGMLCFDIGTTMGGGFVVKSGVGAIAKTAAKEAAKATGKSASKSAVRGLTNRIPYVVRPGVVKYVRSHQQLGRAMVRSAQESTAKFTSTAAKASKSLKSARASTAKVAKKQLPTLAKIASKEVHAPNAFLARIGGASYARSYARQEERIKEGKLLGQDMTAMENAAHIQAAADGVVHAAIAHLIGKNIPFRGKLPSSGKGSTGWLELAGKKGFAPRTLDAAQNRAVARTLLGLNRGGADFVLFEMLMDAYSLTDHEDRANTLDQYINNTDEKFKHLFGSYMLGVMVKAPSVPGNIIKPFKDFKEYKTGREGFKYFQSLTKEKKIQMLDRISDARKEGYAREMELQKKFVEENRELLEEFSREELAHILFHGDRALPDSVISTREGSVQPFEALFVIDGSRVKGKSRELINEQGNVEVTKAMAMALFGRSEGKYGSQGQHQTAVEFMGGKVDLLWATRAETQARKQDTLRRTQEEKKEIPKVANKDISPVRGFVESITAAIQNHSRSAPLKELYKHLTTSERRKIGVEATNRAIEIAAGHGNAKEVLRLRKLGARGKLNLSRWNDPALRPHISRALHANGLAKAAGKRMGKSSEAGKGRELINRIMSSNPRLMRRIIRQVIQKQNTPESPAISRRQFDRLAGKTLGRNINTKQNRFRLARIIESKKFSELRSDWFGDGPGIERSGLPRRLKPSESVPRMGMEVKATEAPTAAEARTIAAAAKARVEPHNNPFAEPRERLEFEKELDRRIEEEGSAEYLRDVEPLDLHSGPRSAPEARKPVEATEPSKSVEETLSRLEATEETTGPAQAPLRKPFEVKDAEGKAVFEGTTAQRVASTIRDLQARFGLRNVEADFGDVPTTGLAESVFALGRANGFSVVIGTGDRLPSIMDAGNGVLVVRANVGVETARSQIASRGATLKWAAEMPKDQKPASWLWHIGQFGKKASELRIAWEEQRRANKKDEQAETAEITPESKQEDASFLRQLLASRTNTGKTAAMFSSLFPYLSREIQGQLITKHPVEIARWIAYQKAGLESVGHGPTRKNNTSIGGVESTARILNVAETGEMPIGANGRLVRNFVTGVKNATKRIAAYTSTPEQVVGHARSQRRIIEEFGIQSEGLNPTRAAIRKKQEEARRVQENESRPPLDLFQADGKPNVTAIRNIEQQYPGVMAEAVKQVRENPNAPSSFEHMGIMFTVNPRKHNGKVVPGAIDARPAETAVETPMAHEASLPVESQVAADRARSLLASSETRETVEVAELGRATDPPSPPSGNPPGSVEYSQQSAPQPNLSGLRQFKVRLMRYLMDQFNLSTAVEEHLNDKPFHDGIKAIYEIEQKIESQKAERKDTFSRMMRELEKDPNSQLVNGRDGRLLIEVLETPIPPTKQALQSHPLTKNLTPKEMEVIMEIKKTFEEHRVEYANRIRRGVAIGYRAAASDAARAAKANEFNPKLNVKVEKAEGTRKNFFAVNDGTSRVTMGRDAFIEFMSNQHVPESWGNKYAYFPHMFFSNSGMRASVEVYRDGVLDAKESQKFGISKENKRELEQSELLDHVERHVDSVRAKHPEAEIKINVQEGKQRVSQDALYLSARQKKALIAALRAETKGKTSDINAALAGKISTRAVDKAFLSALLQREGAKNFSTDVARVFDVALNNHYRNKLSVEMNEAAAPYLKKMEDSVQNGGHPEWVPQHFRDVLHHAVYGTSTAFKMAEQVGGRTFARAVEGTLSSMRAFQFYRQLMRVGQHAINSTQALQLWSLTGSAGFASAVKAYNSKEGKQFLKDYGFFDVNGKFEAGKFGDSLQGSSQLAMLEKTHRVVNAATGKLWNANSEARNQNFAFFAMAHHAQRKLGYSPEKAAEYGRLYGSLFTQYRYSKVNDPVFLRGSVAKTLGQFKRFQIQTLGMAHSLMLNMRSPGTMEGVPRGAFARFMLLNTVMGGVRGSIIGAGAILAGAAGSSMYQRIRGSLDDEYTKGMPDKTPFASQEQAYDYLTSKYGVEVGEMLSMGVFRGVGLDASGTFNLTNIGYDGVIGYLGGPTYGMFKRTYEDAFVKRDALGRGASVRMIESLIESGQATRSLKSLYELCMYWEKLGRETPDFDDTLLGVFSPNKYRSGTSEMVDYRSRFDLFADTIGLRSANGTSQYLIHSNALMWTQAWNDARNKVASAYNRNPEEAERQMRNWNRDYGSVLPMYISDIRTMAENNEERTNTPRLSRTLDRMTDDITNARQQSGLLTSSRDRKNAD